MKWSHCFSDLAPTNELLLDCFWWSARDFGAAVFITFALFGVKTWAFNLISSLMIFFIVLKRIWIITSSRWKPLFNFERRIHSNLKFKPFLCNKSFRDCIFWIVSVFSIILATCSIVDENICSIEQVYAWLISGYLSLNSDELLWATITALPCTTKSSPALAPWWWSFESP